MKQMSFEKTNRWLRLASIYLLIVTLISTGISFARYSTSVDSTGAARVAAFRITTTLASTTQTLDTTDAAASYAHSFTVTNSSEVAVSYHVILSNVPAGVTVTCKVGDADAREITGGTAVPLGTLAPGTTSTTITLTFAVPKETTVAETNIGITVNAVQID